MWGTERSVQQGDWDGLGSRASPHSLTPGLLECLSVSPQPSSPKQMESGSPSLSRAPRLQSKGVCRKGFTTLSSSTVERRGSPRPAFHFTWSRHSAPEGDPSPPLRSPSVSPGAVRARGPWLPTPTQRPLSPVPAGIGVRLGEGWGGSLGPPLSPGSDKERAAESSGAGRGGRPRGR